MKKFLLFTATFIFFASTATYAQIINYSYTKITKEKKAHIGYFQQFAGIEAGLQDEDSIGIGAYYNAGYRFNDRIFVGGGLAVGGMDIYDIGDGMKRFVYVEMYANAKFYLTRTRVQPFFDLSLGGNLNGYANDIMFNPQIGLNYKLKDSLSLYLSVGCDMMPLQAGLIVPRLKLGIAF